jgi:hypothetical protein
MIHVGRIGGPFMLQPILLEQAIVPRKAIGLGRADPAATIRALPRLRPLGAGRARTLRPRQDILAHRLGYAVPGQIEEADLFAGAGDGPGHLLRRHRRSGTAQNQ